MASSILDAAPVNVNGYARLSEVASLVGVSVPTARAMMDRGEFGQEGTGYHFTHGGHARVSVREVYGYLGYDLEQERKGTDSGIYAYCRVSSDKQQKAGSLKRQEERLRKEVAQREGVSPDDINLLSDVASAFGNREGLNRLTDAIIEGNVRVIYCEFQDRLSRVPALTRLIEHLAEKNNVKLCYLDKEDTDPSSIEASMAELVAYMQVVGNRMSAQKSLKVTFKQVKQETIDRINELWAAGNNVRQILRVLKEEGHTSETESGKVSHISEGKVRQILRSGGKVTNVSPNAGKVVAKCQGFSHPFVEFCNAHLKINETWEKGERIDCDDIYARYTTWCENKGVALQPKASVFQRFSKDNIIPDIKTRRQRSMNRTFLRGVELV